MYYYLHWIGNQVRYLFQNHKITNGVARTHTQAFLVHLQGSLSLLPLSCHCPFTLRTS